MDLLPEFGPDDRVVLARIGDSSVDGLAQVHPVVRFDSAGELTHSRIQFAVIQSVAGAVGIEVIPINMGNVTDLARALANFSSSSNGGMIVTASALAATQRDSLISLAARYKLPAVFPGRDYVLNGALISYSAAAGYNTGFNRRSRLPRSIAILESGARSNVSIARTVSRTR
jgi:hypothetical protein